VILISYHVTIPEVSLVKSSSNKVIDAVNKVEILTALRKAQLLNRNRSDMRSVPPGPCYVV
jgi:hypothetical protein